MDENIATGIIELSKPGHPAPKIGAEYPPNDIKLPLQDALAIRKGDEVLVRAVADGDANPLHGVVSVRFEGCSGSHNVRLSSLRSAEQSKDSPHLCEVCSEGRASLCDRCHTEELRRGVTLQALPSARERWEELKSRPAVVDASEEEVERDITDAEIRIQCQEAFPSAPPSVIDDMVKRVRERLESQS